MILIILLIAFILLLRFADHFWLNFSKIKIMGNPVTFTLQTLIFNIRKHRYKTMLRFCA